MPAVNKRGDPETRPSPLRQLVRRAMARGLPPRLFMTSGPRDVGSIALTFDDGPDPAHTPAVLDRLKALGVRATFFVIGEKAEEHPELVARIVDEGHELGHHSYAHTPPHETSAATLVAEARRTVGLLQRRTGRKPRLYRPPYGKLTPGKLLGLWALAQTIVLWNQDPKDFAVAAADPIRQWFASAPLAGGDIVLLHDVHAGIAPALEAIIGRARELGLELATPADWLR